MLYWSKNLDYDDKYNRDKERVYLVGDAGKKKLDACNIALNIAIPVGAFILSGGNLIALGVSYVATDMGLTVLDNLFFRYLPYKRQQNMTIEKRKKVIEELKNKKEDLKQKKKDFEDKYCTECNYYDYRRNCRDCREHKAIITDIMHIDDIIKENRDIVEKFETDAKNEEIERNTKKSADYKDKLEYLISVKERLEHFDDKFKSIKLSAVTKNLSDLIDLLQKKSVGFTIIRASTYTYLDELLNILEMWQGLDDEKRANYKEKIMKIQKSLAENIKSLYDRINNMEVQDIEVSMDVLLSELESLNKEGGEE